MSITTLEHYNKIVSKLGNANPKSKSKNTLLDFQDELAVTKNVEPKQQASKNKKNKNGVPRWLSKLSGTLNANFSIPAELIVNGVIKQEGLKVGGAKIIQDVAIKTLDEIEEEKKAIGNKICQVHGRGHFCKHYRDKDGKIIDEEDLLKLEEEQKQEQPAPKKAKAVVPPKSEKANQNNKKRSQDDLVVTVDGNESDDSSSSSSVDSDEKESTAAVLTLEQAFKRVRGNDIVWPSARTIMKEVALVEPTNDNVNNSKISVVTEEVAAPATKPSANVVRITKAVLPYRLPFSVAYHRKFAGDDLSMQLFIDSLLKHAPTIATDSVSINAAAICNNDTEFMALQALISAVLPMRLGKSTDIEVPREIIDKETTETLRAICKRLSISFDHYVARNFQVEPLAFERCIFRAASQLCSGALAFDAIRRKAQCWLQFSDGEKLGREPWLLVCHGFENATPEAMVKGATEFDYEFDSETNEILLKNTGSIPCIFKIDGLDLTMKYKGFDITFRNTTPALSRSCALAQSV